MPLRRRIGCISGAALLALPASTRVALAHDGAPLAPHDLWRAWHWEPTVMLGLLLAAAVYARGVGRLWARAGRGRGVPTGRAAAWGAGLLALVVALISPLHRLGGALFAAHMAQHLLLVVVAAPLLVLGGPLQPLVWALSPPRRRGLRDRPWPGIARAFHRARRWLLPIGLLHAGALWVWHAPALYQAALRNEALHAVEHATLLGAALLFWWAALPAARCGGAQIPALFAMALQGGALGGLLLASGAPRYPTHAASVAAWGLTPLADQQLAALLMMLPGDAIYLGAALAGAAAWLRPGAARPRPAPRRVET